MCVSYTFLTGFNVVERLPKDINTLRHVGGVFGVLGHGFLAARKDLCVPRAV